MVQQSQGNLSESEMIDFFQLLLHFADIFAGPDDHLGRTSMLQHTIDTGSASPIRQAARRIPPAKKQEVSQLLKDMLKKDVIQQSCSPWAAPIVLVMVVPGSVKTTRNSILSHRRMLIRCLKSLIHLTLHGSRWFSNLDLASGYWQIKL